MRLLVQQTGMDSVTAPRNADDFGENDEDWDVYNKISKDDGKDTVEVLETRLKAIDNLVRKYNPAMNKNKEQTREGILRELQLSKRLFLSVERCQIPELLFQPTMCGIDSGGLTDMFQMIFPQYDNKTQEEMAQNVFVTGGCSLFSGFLERVSADLRSSRPFNQKINIYSAKDPLLDSWRGAASFASNAEWMKK
eukprot:m.120372 g.120372  ORF g.120372 m.120372 type:complete len:194 (+) comp12916_c0_seq48:577-1158(+)